MKLAFIFIYLLKQLLITLSFLINKCELYKNKLFTIYATSTLSQLSHIILEPAFELYMNYHV